MKPLGRKAYGSIPHLPNSRMGPADHACHEGQEKICIDGGRDKQGRIHRVIVTEKLDGSNVAVARINGEIVALIRAGYLASSSDREQHQVFDAWAKSRKWDSLPEGWRICGEWMYQAHGTIYDPSSPFIAFDVFTDKNERQTHDEARQTMLDLQVEGAHVISDGPGMSVDTALKALGETGFHGSKEQVEGAVWRVETGGKFNFLAKYVRPEKIDGKYFGSGPNGSEIVMIPGLAPISGVS